MSANLRHRRRSGPSLRVIARREANVGFGWKADARRLGQPTENRGPIEAVNRDERCRRDGEPGNRIQIGNGLLADGEHQPGQFGNEANRNRIITA